MQHSKMYTSVSGCIYNASVRQLVFILFTFVDMRHILLLFKMFSLSIQIVLAYQEY